GDHESQHQPKYIFCHSAAQINHPTLDPHQSRWQYHESLGLIIPYLTTLPTYLKSYRAAAISLDSDGRVLAWHYHLPSPLRLKTALRHHVNHRGSPLIYQVVLALE